MKFYLEFYQFLVVIFLVLTVFSYLGIAYHYSLIKEISTYAQAIFIGLITFSIPFLWNAYQRILDIKSKIREEGIEGILAKEFYNKAVRHFDALLLYPTAIITFIGITVAAFLPYLVLMIFVIISCIFFLLQTKIFDGIESLASTSLKSFIDTKPANTPDLADVFNELWKKDDTTLEKEFSLRPAQILNSFAKKISELLG